MKRCPSPCLISTSVLSYVAGKGVCLQSCIVKNQEIAIEQQNLYAQGDPKRKEENKSKPGNADPPTKEFGEVLFLQERRPFSSTRWAGLEIVCPVVGSAIKALPPLVLSYPSPQELGTTCMATLGKQRKVVCLGQPKNREWVVHRCWNEPHLSIDRRQSAGPRV